MTMDTLAQKMTEQAIGSLFQNTMLGKIALFAATVERHKHDMMQTNQPYEHVVWPIGKSDAWSALPGRKEADFIYYIDDYRRLFNDYETFHDDRFLVHIYDRFFQIVEETWKNSQNLDEFIQALNGKSNTSIGYSLDWRKMSAIDQMKYVGLEGFPNKSDSGDRRPKTATVALNYMGWIRNYFVEDLEKSRMEFEPYNPKEFDLMVNG